MTREILIFVGLPSLLLRLNSDTIQIIYIQDLCIGLDFPKNESACISSSKVVLLCNFFRNETGAP